MGDANFQESGSLIGEQANPHPSQDHRYIVRVIDEDDHDVCVTYINPDRTNDPWWITKQAWRSWQELTE